MIIFSYHIVTLLDDSFQIIYISRLEFIMSDGLRCKFQTFALFDTFLTELKNENIPTFIISGNHDSAERLAFGRHLFENAEIVGVK